MKKRIIGLLLLAVLIVGCSSSSKEDSKNTVGFSVSTLSNPFFVSMKEAAEAQAKESKVNIEVLDAKDDSSTQASDIETLVNKGVKTIIVNPVDSKAVGAAIKAATEKGVKIITVDRSAEGVEVSSHIASDNIAGGKLAGNYMVDKLNGKGKVIQLEGIPGASATIERGKGFDEAVKGKLDIIARQSANFERAKGLSVMENLVQANKDFQGVFAQNDEMILGALQAIKSKDIITIGFDGNDDALKAIKEGKLTATVIQQPDLMGKSAVETAIKLNNGESVEKTIAIDLILVDAKNVGDFLK